MSDNRSAPKGAVCRIKTIELEHFRGFKQTRNEHSYDTDADLIILTGPNGYGKTSFLEALLLLLTGWHRYDDTKHLVSIKNVEGDCFDSFYLHSEAAAGSPMNGEPDQIEPTETLNVFWSKEAGGEIHRPKNLPESQLGDDPELEARLCGFFQENTELLFDEASKGKTLSMVFSPLPDAIVKSRGLLEDFKNFDLEQKKKSFRQDEWSGNSQEQSIEGIRSAWNEFGPRIKDLAMHAEDWPSIPDDIESETQLTNLAMALSEKVGMTLSEDDKTLPEKFLQMLLQETIGQIRKAEKIDREKKTDFGERFRIVHEKLADTKEQIKRIKNDFKNLEQDLQRFEPRKKGAPGLLEIFESLSDNARRWSQVFVPVTGPGSKNEDRSRFERVKEELDAVDVDEARKCAEIVSAWLMPRQKAQKDMVALEREKKKLDEELEKLRASERLKLLYDLQNDLRKRGEFLSGVMKIAPNAQKKILREIFLWKNLYKKLKK